MFSIVWSANIKALLCPLLLNPILKFTKHQSEPATNQFGEDCLFKIVRPRLLRLQRAGEQQPDVAGQLRGGRSLPSDAQCGVQLNLPQKGDPGKWPDLTWPDLTWPDLIFLDISESWWGRKCGEGEIHQGEDGGQRSGYWWYQWRVRLWYLGTNTRHKYWRSLCDPAWPSMTPPPPL